MSGAQKLIETGWLELAQQSLPHDPPRKVEICKNFFYAGASYCLLMLIQGMAAEGATMESSVDLLSGLDAELEEFRSQLEERS